jgi:hypothetical protein
VQVGEAGGEGVDGGLGGGGGEGAVVGGGHFGDGGRVGLFCSGVGDGTMGKEDCFVQGL